MHACPRVTLHHRPFAAFQRVPAEPHSGTRLSMRPWPAPVRLASKRRAAVKSDLNSHGFLLIKDLTLANYEWLQLVT